MEDVITVPDKNARAVFIPTGGSPVDLACAAYLASLADPTADGRLLGEISMRKIGLLMVPAIKKVIAVSKESPLCGVDLENNSLRIGTLASIETWLREVGGTFQKHIKQIVDQITGRGDLAVVVACEAGDLGVIWLQRWPA